MGDRETRVQTDTRQGDRVQADRVQADRGQGDKGQGETVDRQKSTNRQDFAAHGTR